MKGKVLWFNDFKGYGEILGNSGKRYFFTKEDLEGSTLKSLESKLCSFTESDNILFGKIRAMEVALDKTVNKIKKSHKELE